MKKIISLLLILVVVISITALIASPTLRSIVNPRTSTKIWSVNYYAASYGKFETFWLKSNAQKYAQSIINDWPLVVIENEFTEERIVVKDEYEKYMMSRPIEKKVFMAIVNPPCDPGWERIDQEIFGMHRSGCYPVDFDYDKANEKLVEYLQRERSKNE